MPGIRATSVLPASVTSDISFNFNFRNVIDAEVTEKIFTPRLKKMLQLKGLLKMLERIHCRLTAGEFLS